MYGNNTIGQNLVIKMSIARGLFWRLVIFFFVFHCALWKELETRKKFKRGFEKNNAKVPELGVELWVYGYRILKPPVRGYVG